MLKELRVYMGVGVVVIMMMVMVVMVSKGPRTSRRHRESIVKTDLYLSMFQRDRWVKVGFESSWLHSSSRTHFSYREVCRLIYKPSP